MQLKIGAALVGIFVLSVQAIPPEAGPECDLENFRQAVLTRMGKRLTIGSAFAGQKTSGGQYPHSFWVTFGRLEAQFLSEARTAATSQALEKAEKDFDHWMAHAVIPMVNKMYQTNLK